MSFAEQDPSMNQNRHLDRCPSCGSGLVQADEFEEVIPKEIWFGLLECPDCDWSKTITLDRFGMDELDEILDGHDLELKAILDEMVAVETIFADDIPA